MIREDSFDVSTMQRSVRELLRSGQPTVRMNAARMQDKDSPVLLLIDNLSLAKITYSRLSANKSLPGLTSCDGRLIRERVGRLIL